MSIDETTNEGSMRESGSLTYPSNFPERLLEMHGLSLTFSPNFLTSKAVVGGEPSLGAMLLVPMEYKVSRGQRRETAERTQDEQQPEEVDMPWKDEIAMKASS